MLYFRALTSSAVQTLFTQLLENYSWYTQISYSCIWTKLYWIKSGRKPLTFSFKVIVLLGETGVTSSPLQSIYSCKVYVKLKRLSNIILRYRQGNKYFLYVYKFTLFCVRNYFCFLIVFLSQLSSYPFLILEAYSLSHNYFLQIHYIYCKL